MSNINNDSSRIRIGQNRLQQPAQVQKRSSGVVQTDKKISETAPRKLSGAKSIQEGRVKSVKAELIQLKNLASGSEKTRKAQALATKINGYLNNNRFFGAKASEEDKGAFFKFARDLRGLQKEALKLTESEAAFEKSEVIGRKRANALGEKQFKLYQRAENLDKKITSQNEQIKTIRSKLQEIKSQIAKLEDSLSKGKKILSKENLNELKIEITNNKKDLVSHERILKNAAREFLSDNLELTNIIENNKDLDQATSTRYKENILKSTGEVFNAINSSKNLRNKFEYKLAFDQLSFVNKNYRPKK